MHTHWKLGLAICAAGLAGWFSRGLSEVHAAESAAPGTAVFQLQGTGPDAQLAVYDGNRRIISVYQGVGGGGDTKSCSFQYELGRSGGPIHRRVCAVGNELP